MNRTLDENYSNPTSSLLTQSSKKNKVPSSFMMDTTANCLITDLSYKIHIKNLEKPLKSQFGAYGNNKTN